MIGEKSWVIEMKKPILFLVGVVVFVFFIWLSKRADAPEQQVVQQQKAPECMDPSMLDGKRHNVVRKSIIYGRPAMQDSDRKANVQATATLGTLTYMVVDESTKVWAGCRKGNALQVRIAEPQWLQNSHYGWVDASAVDLSN